MSLTPGTRLGRYEIIGELGAGGMGEVYRARDHQLQRDVAIKILPTALSDRDRLRRFEQEAQAAGRLNHPNVLAIHDIGTDNGSPFIVSELLEGETLQCRLAGAPLPLSVVLDLAMQTVEGLAAAHDKGIVHRDLKPANLFVTSDDGVKILDFGLAKLTQPALSGGTANATAMATLTEVGVVLGTVGYMSPEQVTGVHVDQRSDIFSFGAILYEMLAGTRAFAGGSPIETMSAILRDEPPQIASADESQHEFVRALDRIVRRCLEKRPEDRFQSARDLGFALSEVARGSTAAMTSARWPSARVRTAGWVAAVAIAAVVVATSVVLWRSRQIPPGAAPLGDPIRFAIVPPRDAAFSPSAASLALSPDGRSLAFTASESQRDLALWVQPLGSLEARRLKGAEGAGQIFWSPDSRSIAFGDSSAGFRLKTIDVNTNVVRSLEQVSIPGPGVGSWSRESGIIVSMENVIQNAPFDGRPPVALTILDQTRRETRHAFPAFLPDGRHFLFLAMSSSEEHDGTAYLASVEMKERTPLLKSDSQVVYVPPGYLLYMIGHTLIAQPFDATALRLTGEPVPIAEQVERNTQARRGAFTVSQTSVLAYRQLSETQLVWFDRSGRRLQTLGPAGHYRNPALSPDGTTVAVGRLDPKTHSWDIWTIDTERGVPVRLTTDPALDDMPVWSPDGRQIAFKSGRGRYSMAQPSGLYRQPAISGGQAELLLADIRASCGLHTWDADGLMYAAASVAGGPFDLFRLPMSGERRPLAVVDTPSNEAYAQPSPDRKWIAYASDESGQYEIYIAASRSPREKWIVSAGGGTEPAWRRDGKELFYLSPKRQLMAVPINTKPAPKAGAPVALFDAAMSSLINPAYTRNQYVVTADGQRFLINEAGRAGALSAITVVVNWPSILRQNSGS